MRSRSSALSRVGQYVLVLIVAVSLNFMLPRIMPGSPLALLAGEEVGRLSPEERAQVIAEAGLDQPVWVQYFTYWKNIFTFDFGYSFRLGQPINELILDRLPWTLLVTLIALAVGAVIGTALGAFSAWRHGRPIDVGLLSAMISLESTPSFWLGMLLIAFFAVQLGVLPSFGAETPAAGLDGFARLADIGEHAILPVLTLSVLAVPSVYLTMRYSMLSVMGEDFIRTANAKGLSTRRILFRHVARNAIIPVVTVLALRAGFAFGGTVIVETVFSYPGLGRLVFDAVSGRDYPVMQATFLIFTLAVLAANLIADLIYPRLDPRARHA